MLVVGQKAPDFKLLDQHASEFNSNSLKGSWTILYFYPKDDTPGCTIQACDFTSDFEAFAKMDAKIIGISPDDSTSHQKFIDKFKLKITLLSDPEKLMIKAYDAWGEKNNYGKISTGLIRTTYILCPSFKIEAIYKNVRAKNHSQRILKDLEKLQKA